jgi:hypothetical protein
LSSQLASTEEEPVKKRKLQALGFSMRYTNETRKRYRTKVQEKEKDKIFQVQARMKMLAKATTIQTLVVFAGRAPLLDVLAAVAVADDVVEGTGNVEVTTAEVADRLAVVLPSSTVK